MTSALDDASLGGAFSWDGTWFSGFEDFGIDRVGPDAVDFANNRFWGYALNFISTQVGGCQQQVQAGDEVLFGYDFFSKAHLLKLTGPQAATVGQSVPYTVTDGTTGSPMRGALVAGRRTFADGRARVLFDSPGLKLLKAEMPDALRSNAVQVCVAPAAGGDCGLPRQVGSQGSGGAIDRVPPSAQIKGPRHRKRYARGPRLLRGTVRDDGSGVNAVKLSLRRRVGRRCAYWSGRSERFAGKSCRKPTYFDAGTGPNWSYLLPTRLPRGRYVLDVKAVDRAGNSRSRFVRGRTRVVFEVMR
jgi:hypothetical protein